MSRAPALALALAFALAACGADAPPLAPAHAEPPAPGVSLGGEARIGIVLGTP